MYENSGTQSTCKLHETNHRIESRTLQQLAGIMEDFTEKGPAKSNFTIIKRSMSKEISVSDISTYQYATIWINYKIFKL